VYLLTLGYIYAIFAASWDLVFGYSGQLDFGHSLPFGIGAYVTAFALARWNYPPYSSLFLAPVVCLVAFLALGRLVLRLRGPYLAIVTLSFSEATNLIITTSFAVTGGEEGIPRIPSIVSGITPNYYFALSVMAGSIAVMYLVCRSQIGLNFIAIRDDDIAAEAAGVNTTKYKTLAFALGALFAGLAGALYGTYTSLVNPATLSIDLSFRGISMTVVGGLGTLFGSVAGAVLLTFLLELLPNPQLRLLIYGMSVVVVLLFMPQGLFRKLSDLLSERMEKGKG
jgi:branched-chain amino acid transport system permease protein